MYTYSLQKVYNDKLDLYTFCIQRIFKMYTFSRHNLELMCIQNVYNRMYKGCIQNVYNKKV